MKTNPEEKVLSIENSLEEAEKLIEDAETKSAVQEELDSAKKQKFKDFGIIMDMYHNGTPEEVKQAKLDATQNLKGFIIYLIMKNYYTYCKNDFADMLQCGYIGVMTGLKIYDPTRTMPTTFFKTYIKSEISKYITEYKNGSTVHYASALNKVNKAVRYFEANNIAYNDATIAEYTGISIISVKEALASKEAAISVNYQDEFKNATDLDSGSNVENYYQPEKIMMEEERSDALKSALTVLTEIEKNIILAHYGFYGPAISFKEIGKTLKLPTSTVKKYHQLAINKLKDSELKDFFSDKYSSESWLEDDFDFFPEVIEDVETEFFDEVS